MTIAIQTYLNDCLFFYQFLIMSNEVLSEFTAASFKVTNMVCEGCAEKITTALTSLPGVKEVKLKVFKKQIFVNYYPEQINQEEIKSVLGKHGFAIIEL